MTGTETPPSTQNDIGAVVLTWRDREQTAHCVARLLASGSISRVHVIDNEADGTIGSSIPSDPRVSFRELTDNTGFAYGVNAGIRDLLDDPEIGRLLVINNDAVLEPRDLDMLAAALDARRELGVVGPRIVTPDGEQFSAGGILNRVTWGIRQPRPGEHPDFLTWACVLARREVFVKVGLLDERFFMYWEDVDFGLRMTAGDVAYAEVAEATLVHAVSSSHSRAGSRIMAYSSQAFRHFLRLHGGPTTFHGLLRLTTKLAVTLLQGDVAGARYVRAGWRLGRHTTSPAYPELRELP